MRIVYIARLAPPYYGGAGRAAIIEAKHVQRYGHEVRLLTSQIDQTTEPDDVYDGVPIHRFPHHAGIHWRSVAYFYLRCAGWLFKHRQMYDLVVIEQMPKFWVPMFIVLTVLRKPTIATMTLYGADDVSVFAKRRLGWLWVFMLRRLRAIRSVGHQMIEASRPYIDRPGFYEYLPHPMDSDRFYPATPEQKRTLREGQGIGDDAFVVIFSGAVIQRKGIDLLVEAWAQVIQVIPDALLLVAGPREFGDAYSRDNIAFSAALDAHITELGIGDQIIFLGECADRVPDLLRMSDAYVLPSRQEGLGQATLEAMGTALACIICKGPWYNNEFIRDGENGFVCELDPDAIAIALISVGQNPTLAQHMGQQAAATIQQTFHPDVIVPRLIALYERSTYNVAAKTLESAEGR